MKQSAIVLAQSTELPFSLIERYSAESFISIRSFLIFFYFRLLFTTGMRKSLETIMHKVRFPCAGSKQPLKQPLSIHPSDASDGAA
jgi:hypothetical protein